MKPQVAVEEAARLRAAARKRSELTPAEAAKLLLDRRKVTVPSLAGQASYEFCRANEGTSPEIEATWKNGGGYHSEKFPNVDEFAVALAAGRFNSAWRFGLPLSLFVEQPA